MTDRAEEADKAAEAAETSAPDYDEAAIGGHGAIVPASGIAGRSLTLVIAIMSFLSCLTIGSVMLVWTSVESWREAVVSEVTIQVVPSEGAAIEDVLAEARAAAAATAGVADARVIDLAETARLLEPWLGEQPNLSELPVPRLIAVRLAPDQAVDLDPLRLALATLPGATLEDHTVWRDQLGAMGRLLIGVGVTLLVLILAATTLTVVFATRGAMAGNRDTVRVLDLVGAGRDFIAAEFQRHFLSPRPARRALWRRDGGRRLPPRPLGQPRRRHVRRADLPPLRHLLDRLARLSGAWRGGRARLGDDGRHIPADGAALSRRDGWRRVTPSLDLRHTAPLRRPGLGFGSAYVEPRRPSGPVPARLPGARPYLSPSVCQSSCQSLLPVLLPRPVHAR